MKTQREDGHVTRGGDWSSAAINQGKPKIASNKRLGEHGSADTLILDFQLRKYEDICLLF